MYKFAWTNYKGVGAIGSQKFNHVVNVNKQLTRLLLIQVNKIITKKVINAIVVMVMVKKLKQKMMRPSVD